MRSGRRGAFPLLVVGASLLSAAMPLRAQDTVPPVDRRAEVRTLRTPWPFDPPGDAAAWRARALQLRQQVRVATGLWPLPEKRPLRAQVFGRIERGDHSVEKVYFESLPGFYVAGNLYRPRGRPGPFPGVLLPHGHWDYGRLENGALASIPAAAISLARQGYVAFSFDMVGYNDSRQVDHRLQDATLSQWGIGSLSLHLWNAIRALDFLESLPEVDPARLASAGASGGGTQTFLLSAVDDRLRASAPVNMVSHTMQGGDVCENAPVLRLDTSNVEIAALAAPRPMLLVSATGDWTRDTPHVEFPAVQAVYARLGAQDRVRSEHFEAEHNFHQGSREAVYAFLGRELLGLGPAEASALRESRYDPGQPADLLVFHGRAMPAGTRTQEQIVRSLVEEAQTEVARRLPRDASGLQSFRETLGVSYAHALAAEWPAAADLLEAEARVEGSSGARALAVGRRGRGDRVALRTWAPTARAAGAAVLVVHPDGIAGAPAPIVDALRRRGRLVASLDAFNTGAARAPRDTSDPYFTTYNRTDDALRVQDVLTVLAWLKHSPGVRRVSLLGLGRAGLWALLAAGLAPGLEAVAADVDRFPTSDDEAYLGRVFVPLFRKAGGFDTAILLGLGARVLVHNTGDAFGTARVEEHAPAIGALGRLRVERAQASEARIVAWLTAGR